MLVHLYNLLGDPAVPMAVPGTRLELDPRLDDAGRTVVEGRVGSDRFHGEALVEWLDADGSTVGTEAIDLTRSSFQVTMPDDIGSVRSVRAYVWDPSAEIDALGWSTTAPHPYPERESDVAAGRRHGPESAEEVAESVRLSSKEAP
jgi:hypothetical protein